MIADINDYFMIRCDNAVSQGKARMVKPAALNLVGANSEFFLLNLNDPLLGGQDMKGEKILEGVSQSGWSIDSDLPVDLEDRPKKGESDNMIHVIVTDKNRNFA